MLRLVARDAEQLPAPPPKPAPLPPQLGALRLVSFFRFTKLSDADRVALQADMESLLASLNCRGSVYVAPEGVNGQLSVPAAQLDELAQRMPALPGLEGLQVNAQHASLGTVDSESEAAPYRKLIVRLKGQILTDGLEEEHDWERAGTELDAADWHEMLPTTMGQDNEVEARAADGVAKEGATPLLLDCRNGYESDAGTFEGAEPLNTDIFSESWDVLRKRLDGVPRETPIMTFCTGGIRCVKTNAFLEQELGFSNTYRLRDGIHGYLRHVNDSPGLASKWQGENFVFYEKGEDEGAVGDEEDNEQNLREEGGEA